VNDLAAALAEAGVQRGDLVGLFVRADGACTVATDAGELPATAAAVAVAEERLRPRWTVWSQQAAQVLIGHGVKLATCWDVAAVHRLLFGGWRADPGYAWACLHGQQLEEVPVVTGEPDLFSAADDAAERPAFGAVEALAAARLQLARLTSQDGAGYDDASQDRVSQDRANQDRISHDRVTQGRISQDRVNQDRISQDRISQDRISQDRASQDRVSTARCESTAELLCAELSADGLPVGLAAAEKLLTQIIGPRPRGPSDAAAIRAARDALVLRHAPDGVTADLRSPVQVKSLLAAAGIDVPDTRRQRLEEYRERSALVAALLDWRKAERFATTYGYAWLDEHLGPDGRLRGSWTGSDGAAGRMTASSGLHNMPAAFRQAVLAEDGHRFVRADLGQIEPRVLAAVSGDAALAAAAATEDMYLPVAAQLGVDRPTAKVAMIAAMYGQTTGHGGVAGRRMRTAYPVAMGYLDAADRSARAGRDLRTYGGRLLRMSSGGSAAHEAARGRYGRNAVVQGAAAELFKMWAVTVRARTAPLGAQIVLCLHDELLVHVPAARAEQTAELVSSCLAEAASRWAPPGCRVRFIADITTAGSWAEAKV
jgi:DNA polymerase-1